MKNLILVSTAAYDGYDLTTAFREISAVGVDLVEIAFIQGYTDPFTEDYFNGVEKSGRKKTINLW